MRAKKRIAFGVDTYLPATYTWIENFYRNIDKYEVITFTAFRQPSSYPLKADGALFACPGLVSGGQVDMVTRIFRLVLRTLVDLFGIASLYFELVGKCQSIQLIHGHFAHVAWRYLPVARRLRVPLVVSFYGYDYEYLPQRSPKWRARYKRLFTIAAVILTEGEFGRARLIAGGCDPERVRAHHLGVEVDRIPYQVRMLTDGGCLSLVQVASFVEKKGHAVLIDALRHIKKEGLANRILLTLIGNGPLKSAVRRLVKQYGLDESVAFVNHVPYHQLHSHLLRHHVFIHPSVTAADGDCEGGAPVVLLDAQATGMPVIATQHCDIPEEVIHGVTGLLVPERDAMALAAAIRTFIDSPELIGVFGKAARTHIAREYCARKQTKSLIKLYDRLLHN